MNAQQQTVDVPGSDAPIPTFVADPGGAEPRPAVILYMDAPGIREELRDFARRIAEAGYLCLLPDMFYRLGTLRFDLSQRDERMNAVIQAALRHLDHERVARDGAALLAFLDRHPRAKPGPRGLIGYCMSGQYVMAAAGRFPDQVGAVASLHGVGLVTDAPDSPHLLTDRISAELYFGFASDDPLVPDNVIPTLRETLAKREIAHDIDIFPDTQHGFSFPARPVYAEAAAEASWEKIFEVFGRRL
ncbi:MAG: dienelactone hydrolase family protein [Kiloniellales bacterium]|nr:dienelactone hydrolase family protein [Kiloniellales bacterium]